jgi:hypothetical protein
MHHAASFLQGFDSAGVLLYMVSGQYGVVQTNAVFECYSDVSPETVLSVLICVVT